jgi:hypothetical protein
VVVDAGSVLFKWRWKAKCNSSALTPEALFFFGITYFKTGVKEKRSKQKKITAFARIGQGVSKDCGSVEGVGGPVPKGLAAISQGTRFIQSLGSDFSICQKRFDFCVDKRKIFFSFPICPYGLIIPVVKTRTDGFSIF